jgi:colanic acid/amylovoran biosynthesis glycosyltransferase
MRERLEIVKIAYIMNSYPMTSTTFIRREIIALEQRGIEVLRIALRTWDGKLVEPADNAEHERTRYVLHDGPVVLLFAAIRMLVARPSRFTRALVLACRMSRRADRPLLVHLVYLAEACRIEPWLRQSGIQHVHAHFGTNAAEVAMLLHLLGGPQWSFSVHGPEEFDKAPLIGLAEKVRRCAFVVAISSYGRSQLYRQVSHQYWPKVHVVHCGLDQQFFAPTASPDHAPPRLVCVGRLCEQKGQILLIKAAHHLAMQGVSFELVLAGDGEMRGEVETLILNHGLQANVRITGWISSDDVRNEIMAARALVLPSFAEGLPVVIMEAMALRRPVISTYIAGIPELVRAGVDGWLIPAGDVKALSDAMIECLNSSADKLRHMGEAACQRVLKRHSVAVQAEKLEKLFGEALGTAS